MVQLFSSVTLTLALLFAPHFSYAYSNAYILQPPPSPGSLQEKQDFVTLHQIQNTRTQIECDRAALQETMSLDSFFGPSTGILTAQEVKKASKMAEAVINKAVEAYEPFKVKFNRPRPYVTDHSIHPCIGLPGKGKAYPSGHATTGIVLARALAVFYPEKRDAILKQGEQIGMNRVIGGVHHPSDVAAGQTLGEQVANDMFKKPVE